MKWLALALALGLATAGCGSAPPPAIVAPPIPQDQQARAEVLEAFLGDADVAAAKFRPVWEAGMRGGLADGPRPGDFTMLAIAQCMVQHGKGDRAEFLRFAKAKLSSSDVNVIEAALWVFAGADDADSLATLFSYLPDQRGSASMGAESVIAYRRGISHMPGRSADAIRIEKAVADFCAAPAHAVRPLCAYTGPGTPGETP